MTQETGKIELSLTEMKKKSVVDKRRERTRVQFGA